MTTKRKVYLILFFIFLVLTVVFFYLANYLYKNANKEYVVNYENPSISSNSNTNEREIFHYISASPGSYGLKIPLPGVSMTGLYSASASSEAPAETNYTFTASNLLDGNTAYVWRENGDNYGIGESVTLTNISGATQTFDMILMGINYNYIQYFDRTPIPNGSDFDVYKVSGNSEEKLFTIYVQWDGLFDPLEVIYLYEPVTLENGDGIKFVIAELDNYDDLEFDTEITEIMLVNSETLNTGETNEQN